MDPRILQFLLFAALFYFLMRFGCGSHAVHGHHHREGHEGHEVRGGPQASSKDPVCGMEVEPNAGYAEKYQNREYRFCLPSATRRASFSQSHLRSV
jgi:YHS domain-containing protein